MPRPVANTGSYWMTLSATALAELRATLKGDALVNGDAGYDDNRQVWNAMIDRRPAVIAMCETREDIAAAIRFAREHGLIIAIRGGGHSAVGSSVCEGGMMINLRRMHGVAVDASSRIAVAAAGATWGEFDAATQAQGLATTGGAVATTGIAGLTLGGGLGWLMRSRGLTCDNLRAVELVTAKGEFVRASETENPELFWGLRGGGGNFGVAYSFEYGLHPVTNVTAGEITYDIDRYRDAFRLYREVTQNAPDELTVYLCALIAEGAPAITLYFCHSGALAEAEAAIAPLRSLGRPLFENTRVRPYGEWQWALTGSYPHGRHYYRRSNWVSDIGDDVIDALEASVRNLPGSTSTITVEHAGGAVQRVPADATAFTHRDVEYDLLSVAAWDDPAETERNIEWTKTAWAPDAIGRASKGVYVNYLGFGEGQDRVRAAYGLVAYDRLVDLKRKWDPENTFRMNPNIDPAGA